ncbi:MAG: 5-formyltetrahydrofolate cyclo-ligase [Kangiellaceae bacterium]|nr:5-formyltetrahydrofolate cyclo-ligase [Kangiellaceae bacterium]
MTQFEPAPEIQAQKREIRQTVRQLRNQISQQESTQAGNNLCEHLLSMREYPKAKSVACFLSFDGEINTGPLISKLHQDNKICLLPYLRPSKPNRLWFMPYEKGDKLIRNRLGISEVCKPVNSSHRISTIDLLLMPLVAFDINGNRLGMGGGFYDASLCHLLDPEFKHQRPLCLGIAFERQKLNRLPKEPWDFPLDGVITENKIYRFDGVW